MTHLPAYLLSVEKLKRRKAEEKEEMGEKEKG